MKYPYFRGLEADRYSFYRVPKALIKVDLFEKMSGDAKLLYAVLLDRMNLSLKNGWQDENGNAYIICTIDEIMDSIRCARQKAVKLLDELEHEYQLIERRRQGLGKPNLLYVKDLYEHQYQVAVQKQEADFKKVMLAVNDIEKAFSHGNPWLMKFRAISIPEKLERTHLKEWLDHVWIVDFEQVEVILQESEWKRFFPEEWLNNGEEDCNGKKE